MSYHYKERLKMVEIGTSVADVDLLGIRYFACKVASDGPGGDMVSPRLVPNTTAPVSFRDYHKWWVIILGFDQRVDTAFLETDVEEGVGTGKAIEMLTVNTLIGKLVATIILTNAAEETWTFESKHSKVARYDTNIRDGEEHQITEVKIICIGTRLVNPEPPD